MTLNSKKSIIYVLKNLMENTISNIYTSKVDWNNNNEFSLINYLTSEYNKVFIITDDIVANFHLDKIEKQIDCEVVVHIIKSGEKHKNLNTIENIYDTLIQNNFRRNDLIIGLGGGVVLDIAGFVASTYMRGVKFINIPTTLLAMADSSVGGKTGFDICGYKNMVGTFYQPIAVIIDINLLETLDALQYNNGLIEVLKYGIILDNEFYEYFKKNMTDILNRDKKSLQYIVEKSVITKAKVVEQDEKDNNKRQLLNFGHTFGHSLEKYSDFQLLHGYAVGYGMIMSLNLSINRGYINNSIYNEVKNIIKIIIKQSIKFDININDIYTNILLDKKNNDDINIVVIKNIGDAVITKTDDAEIKIAVNEFVKEIV